MEKRGFQFSPFGTKNSKERELKARLSRDKDLRAQKIKQISSQTGGIALLNQKERSKSKRERSSNDESFKRETIKTNKEENAATKAKKKLKNLQNVKSNQRLARLEKVFTSNLSHYRCTKSCLKQSKRIDTTIIEEKNNFKLII